MSIIPPTGYRGSTFNNPAEPYWFPNISSTAVSYLATILADNPVSVWMLGETSGSTANDSADSNNGTYETGTTLNQPSIIPAVSNGSVAFTINNNGVEVPDATNIHVGDTFSIEAWIMLTTLGDNTCIMSQGGGSFFLRTGSDNKIQLLKSQIALLVESTSAILINTAYYIAATKNAGVATHLYINGSDVTGTVTNQTMTSTTSGLSLFGADAGFPTGFPGRGQGVALYNYPLTAAQVAAHYAAGIA